MRLIGKRTPITVANVDDALMLAGMQRNRAEKRRARVLLLQVVRSPIGKRRMKEQAAAQKRGDTETRLIKVGDELTRKAIAAAQNAGAAFANGLRRFFRGGDR